MEKLHKIVLAGEWVYFLYFSFTGDAMMVRQRELSNKTEFLLFNISKMLEKQTILHLDINKSVLNVVTNEAKFFQADLEFQEIYSKKPDYLTLMSKFEFEEVDIRRLTRPNSKPNFKICCEHG